MLQNHSLFCKPVPLTVKRKNYPVIKPSLRISKHYQFQLQNLTSLNFNFSATDYSEPPNNDPILMATFKSKKPGLHREPPLPPGPACNVPVVAFKQSISKFKKTVSLP
jgi:hypothetical protein